MVRVLLARALSLSRSLSLSLYYTKAASSSATVFELARNAILARAPPPPRVPRFSIGPAGCRSGKVPSERRVVYRDRSPEQT